MSKIDSSKDSNNTFSDNVRLHRKIRDLQSSIIAKDTLLRTGDSFNLFLWSRLGDSFPDLYTEFLNTQFPVFSSHSVTSSISFQDFRSDTYSVSQNTLSSSSLKDVKPFPIVSRVSKDLTYDPESINSSDYGSSSNSSSSSCSFNNFGVDLDDVYDDFNYFGDSD